MREIAVGPALVELLTLCYRANVPVLMFGETGVGKSQIVDAAAAAIGGIVVSLNLSIIEAVDLTGIPTVADGATTFAAAARLPRFGRGYLFLDEIGRANQSLQAAALQLLTERRLNDYVLPAGFLPIAATNIGEGYQVGDLDPALLARFVCIRVVPSLPSWRAWAQTAGVHASVLEFSALHSDLFRARTSNPRAWEMVSNVLHAAAAHDASPTTVEVAIAGLVGEWARPFMNFLSGVVVPPAVVIERYGSVRTQVMGWRTAKRTDILHATFSSLLQHLDDIEASSLTKEQHRNITVFIDDPARDMWNEWAADRLLAGEACDETTRVKQKRVAPAVKMRLAIERLLDAFPLYGNIVAQGTFEAAPIDTMAVTLRSQALVFLYSPTFVRKHDLAELTAVLEHEALHVLLRHLDADPAVYPDRVARTRAEETTCNEHVVGPLPCRPLTIDMFGLPPDESTESRYHRLRRAGKAGRRASKSVQKPGKSVQKGRKTGQSPGSSDQTGEIQTVDDHSLWPSTITAEDRDAVEHLVATAVRATPAASVRTLPPIVRAAVQGLPAAEGVTESIAAGTSNAVALLQSLRRLTRPVATWTRRNRRFPETLAVPGRKWQRLRIVCVIDTSGSMDAAALATVNGALRSIASEHDVWVIECDDTIQASYRYRAPLRSVHGRGNTDLRPPFESPLLAELHPHALVYMTDGLGVAPAQAPPIPVFWAILEGGQVPATWGTAIQLR